MQGLKFALCVVVGALWTLGGVASAQNAEFNYNGRVNANGQPFTGTGRFKFAIVNAAGTITYWANDGATLNGAEPTTFINNSVANGFFSINIGDTTIAGMADLDPTIFNNGPLFLRTWFSDGSGFELLTPDRRIVNPDLLGLQSRTLIKLYVNAGSGNDQFPGLTPGKPKKTIQAAWDALPAILQTTATINIAAGTYRETVKMDGKLLAGNAQIVIIGNTANPNSVRVTGSNAGADTTPVRARGFSIENQKGLVIKGILFNYTASTTNGREGGIVLDIGSDALISDCKFVMNGSGISCLASRSVITDCEFSAAGPNVGNAYGVKIFEQANGDVQRVNCHDLKVGVAITHLAMGRVSNSTINNCFHGGQFAYVSSVVLGPGNSVSNCTYAVVCGYNAITVNATTVSYSGNGQNMYQDTGGQFYN